MPSRLVSLGLSLAGVWLLAACGSSTSPYGGGGGGGGGGGSTGGHLTTITVGNGLTFRPTPDTVPAGNVTFSWAAGSVNHTVTWDSGPGTLPADIGPQSTGSVVVSVQMGTYLYHCSIHAGMSGTIVVQ